MGYSGKVFSGFSWQTSLRVVLIGVGFVRIFFLARLLTPQDIGVYAIVLIALGLLEATTETGINLTILQSKHTIDYFIDTAWIISIARGLCIAVLMIAASFFISYFYQQPELMLMIMFAAVVPIVKGFINPTIGALHKNFEFSTQVYFQFARYLAEAIFAVVFVFFWPNVWSLLFSLVCAALFEVVISITFLHPKPKFRFHPDRARLILNNSKVLTAQALLSYVVENADDLIIGKTLGTYALGLYHNAYALTHKLLYESAKSASYGLLPVYTRLIDDKERLKRGLMRSTLFFGSLLILGTLIISILAKPLVMFVLGEKWQAIIPIIAVLAVAALLQSLTSLLGTFLYATKKYAGITISLLIQFAVLISSMWILSTHFGLLGAAWSVVIARLVGLPLLVWGIVKKNKPL